MSHRLFCVVPHFRPRGFKMHLWICRIRELIHLKVGASIVHVLSQISRGDNAILNHDDLGPIGLHDRPALGGCGCWQEQGDRPFLQGGDHGEGDPGISTGAPPGVVPPQGGPLSPPRRSSREPLGL